MREEQITNRIKFFLKDLSESIKPLESLDDKIHFVKSLKNLLIGVFKSDDEYFDEDAFIDEHFLSRFRSRMKPFVAIKLHYYFSSDPSMQEIISNKMKLNPQVIFDREEMVEYTLRMYNLLDLIKTNLYLTEPEKAGDKLEELAGQRSEESAKTSLKIKKNEFTRGRQALAMLYLFKSLGLNPNVNMPIANLAKLAHVFSAMPYEDINNSTIYRVMKDFLSVKNKKDLLSDLEFVKKHFELANLKDAVALLEKEIATLEQKQKFKK